LYIAALTGRKAVVRVLLDRGEDTEAMSDCGVTPLFAACMKGHDAVAQMLLGSTPLSPSNGQGQLPLRTVDEE